MDERRARAGEAPDERLRIAAGRDDLIEFSLLEPHGRLSQDVHGRYHLQGHVLTC
jgi:hypothetical protein